MSPDASYEVLFDDAVIAVSDEMQIVAWNESAERTTGIRARRALGRPCWEVLAAADTGGGSVCTAACPLFARASRGEPIPRRSVMIKRGSHARRLTLATLMLKSGENRLLLHILPGTRGGSTGGSILTPRQHEVLTLLAAGLRTRAIASRLFITEDTVNNHVQGILRRLGCKSRLEAVAEGRRRGLV